MKKYFYLFLFSFGTFIIFNVANANGPFYRNLSIGSAGPDVKILQQFLNQFSDTKLADFGPGSLGNETEHFGPATKNSVIKFQNKYKEEVLYSLNLTYGTGFFGNASRVKANSLISSGVLSPFLAPQSQPVSTAPSQTSIEALINPNTQFFRTSNSAGGQANRVLAIRYISPEVVKLGQDVDIYGSGFTPSSRVYVDEDAVSVEYISSDRIKILIPNNLNLVGPRVVRVSNTSGDTIMNSPQFVLILDDNISRDYSYVSKMEKEIKYYNEQYKKIASEVISYSNLEEDNSGINRFVKNTFYKIKELVFPQKVYAQLNNFYGGLIQETNICTCLYNLAVTFSVNDLASNQKKNLGFSLMMGSRLRQNFNIFTPGINVIGGYNNISFTCQNTQTVVPVYTCDTGNTQDGLVDSIIGVGTGAMPI